MSPKVKIFNASRIIYSVCGEWMGLMSGGLSVIFTILGLHQKDPQDGKLFIIAAFVALWVFVFRMAYKNYPKFKLSCNRDIDGCATPKDDYQMKMRFFRIRVETSCFSGIENCLGHLTKIEKDGNVLFEHDSPELPFAKAEEPDCLSKRILPGIEYWLDVLTVYIDIQNRRANEAAVFNPNLESSKNDTVNFATRPFHSPANDISGKYIFENPGEYILHVSVSGKGVPTSKAQLKFTWSGKANTSTIERIK